MQHASASKPAARGRTSHATLGAGLLGLMVGFVVALGLANAQVPLARTGAGKLAGPLLSVVVAPETSPSSPKPTLPDDEKPLLLDDEPATNAPALGADNSRCQVCHINFMQEFLTVSHAKTNIGCATCHGPSDSHIADESWASGGNGTAPDIMFPRLKIYWACIACHKPEQVFVKAQKHQPVWWSIAYQEVVCTDCHGHHRMVTRRCKWK